MDAIHKVAIARWRGYVITDDGTLEIAGSTGTTYATRGDYCAPKGGAPRRVPLTQRARSTLSAFVADRCGALPAPGSASEREPLLWGRPPASGRAWTPGMSTSAMRRRLIALRDAAIARVEAQQQREPSLARVGALAEVAGALRTCSPHELRHGLAYRLRSDGVDLGVIRQILGHARLETTVRYGKPTARDVRAAMEERGGG